MRVSERQKGAFFSPLSAPFLSVLTLSSLELPHIFHLLAGAIGEQRQNPLGKNPSQLTIRPKKQGTTSSKPTTVPCAWGTHDLALRPRVGTVRNSLQQIPHANFYGGARVTAMKTHRVKIPSPSITKQPC